MKITHFKSPMNTSHPGNGKKILESTKNIEKPKFILDKNDIIAELNKIKNTTDNGNYYNNINEHIKKTWKAIESNEKGIDYIWNLLLCDGKVLADNFKVYFPVNESGIRVATNTSKKDIASFAVLLIRIERFKLKLVVIELLMSYSVVKIAALDHKLESIRTLLKQRKVYFDAKVAPKIYEITYASTITAIAKAISESEAQLRDFLIPLTTAYRIQTSAPWICLEPKIQAYFSKIKHSSQEFSPAHFNNIDIYEFIITVPPKPSSETFIELGQQKYLLIIHNKDNREYYAIGYLTSKKVVNFHMINN
jgi:hypothetical protein